MARQPSSLLNRKLSRTHRCRAMVVGKLTLIKIVKKLNNLQNVYKHFKKPSLIFILHILSGRRNALFIQSKT